jgi:MFS family permease
MFSKYFNYEREILIVSALAFLSDLSNSIITPTITLLAEELGASYQFIGIMVAAATLTRLLLVQPIGILIDKYDKRMFILLGFIFYEISFLITLFATTPIHLLVSRLVRGVGSALVSTTSVTMVTISSLDRKGEAVGFYATLMGLGFSIGPILGGFIAFEYSYDASYLLSVILAFFAIIIILKGLEKKERTNVTEKDINRISKDKERKKGYLSLLQNKELLAASIGSFFISEAIGADISFFPIYGQSLSLNESLIGLFLGIRAIFSTIIRIPIGKAIKRISSLTIMMISLFLASLGLILLPQFRIIWLLPVFLSFEGIGFGMFLVAVRTYIGETTDEENRGAAFGLNYTFSGVGSVLNMTILGFIAGNFGVSNTFRFTSMMCILGLIIMVVLTRSNEKENVL